ncbi:DUF4267 domain-containing protein [Hymenobacter terrenus]|uniref:DUF4267 domain-containing protein n=1 Tax=Hymenobacter terrenus TaxID=1629124 RepID=UPI0018CCE0FA|nr:DUF4267 domain-containing protein [Hymenobacter terrenus]
MRRSITRGLSLLTGLGLVFIGVRFLLAPRVGAEGFGVFLPSGSSYAFHYAKGIRDVFSGLLMVVFVGRGYDRALGWVMLLGTLIPSVDVAVVLAQPTATLALELPHLIAIGLCLGLGISFLTAPAAAADFSVRQPQALAGQAS